MTRYESMKCLLKLAGVTLVFLLIGSYVVLHTSTRMAIYLNFRISVPSSATAIEIEKARDFTGRDGDGSVAYFTIPQKDFERLISQYQYCDRCNGYGPFISTPDSLIGRYPMVATEFDAPIGDVLFIQANVIDQERLRVRMSVDWN